ncbi:MAG: MBL fold metallo-hydrolase [Betaproteobacteria bacterium]|nr:MAG: MBL fold metallo-hydrolase [Betaproteobacteria bacterium]
MNIVFRQFFHEETATLSYLLADALTGHALLIDPVCEHAGHYLSVLQELELDLVWLLETHTHAEDPSGTLAMKEHTGARTVGARSARAGSPDLVVGEGDTVVFGDEIVRVIATPGHTPDSVTYRWRDRLFTGDSLLIGGCGRCDFTGGDAGTLYDSISERLLSLPDETLVYPGHDYRDHRVSSVGQERLSNERIRGKSRAEFVEVMNNLRHSRPGTPPGIFSSPLCCDRSGDLIDIHAA